MPFCSFRHLREQAGVGGYAGAGHLVDSVTWPPKGKEWYGIARRLRSDITKAAPFPNGKGGKGATLKGGFLFVHELPTETSDAHIAGLWATDTELFAACPHDNTIRVFELGDSYFTM